MSNVYSFQNQPVLFNNTISNTITSGTNLSLLNTSTTSQIPLIIYQGSLTTTNNVTMNIGVAGTSNNSGIIRFNYNGASSTSNTLQFGLQGQTGLTIDGNNNIITNGTIVSNLSTGTNLSLLNTASSSQIPLSILQSSLTTSATSQILLGRANTTNNAGLITYTNNTVSSATNTLSLGLVGKPSSLSIDGSGIVTANYSLKIITSSIDLGGAIGEDNVGINALSPVDVTYNYFGYNSGLGNFGKIYYIHISDNHPDNSFFLGNFTTNLTFKTNGSWALEAEFATTACIMKGSITHNGILTISNTSGNTLIVSSTASSSSSVTSNSISTLGGIGVTGQSFFSNNTTSTSTTTGAIVVTGGVGVGGNLNVGGNIVATNALQAIGNTSITTQGLHIQWNRSGANGEGWIINQKGGGGGTIIFGESTLANVVTETFRIGPTGVLSGYNDFTLSRSVNGAQRIVNTNTNSGSLAFTMIELQNNVSSCGLYLNSSTKTDEGGANAATLANNAGALRLQNSASASTITLSGNTTTFANNVAITGSTSLGNVRLNDNPIYLRSGSDNTHGIVYNSTSDGPNIFGFTGGRLSVQSNTPMTWNSTDININRLNITNGNASITHFNFSGTSVNFIRGNTTIDGIVTMNGNLIVTGSVSKGSGTFDIQHPLKNDNKKRLIHSFIEGPRCDLIYRGTVKLTNGIAYVNLDTDCVQKPESAMSAGTFEALCTNPVKYLHNNNTFDKLRGNISGNILTIVCENNQSNANVDWMVIAERKDTFIKKWDCTNEDGYLITEYTQTT